MSEKIEWIEIGSPSYVEGKFGQAVSLDANNKIQTKNPVTFGGADFTIDFWANVGSFSINTVGNIFYATSKSSEYLRINHASKSAYFYFEAYDGINLLSNNTSLMFPSNTWKHFEFCYKHETGNGYIFLDGKRLTITTPTQNRRIERLDRTITLGGLPCLFEEFRILDGVCLHTEDFDVPTAPYELTETGILTFIDNDGVVHEILNKTTADVVTYSNTTLANALENFEENLTALGEKQDHSKILDKLSALNFSENKIIYSVDSDTLTTSPVTTVGKKVLAASDFENFRGIIQAPTAETFLWDETEKVVWQKVGSPTISSANAKFSKALQCSVGNYVWFSVTLGGQDFTIDLWLRKTDTNYGSVIFSCGDFGFGCWNSRQRPYVGSQSDGTYNWGTVLMHVEFCYSHSAGKMYVFKNGGATKWEQSVSYSRAARTVTLGNAAGAISEFRILDGVCLHTEDFDVPTAPYELTDKTISLLHFDKAY